MKENVIAEKNGFQIRFAEEEDAENYYRQNYCPLDKELARLTGCKETFTKDEVADFFLKSVKDGDRYFFLITAFDGKIIGEAVLNEIDETSRSANFRIALFHAADRGKGIGTWATEVVRDFAFTELKLRRLELTVLSFNARAEKTYLKAGYKRERAWKASVCGGNADEILMSISKSDWEALRFSGQDEA